MTQPQYRTLLAFARTLLDNHPDQTLEPGDLVAEAYLRHGDDGGKMRKFMVGYARQTRAHPRRWLGYIPNPKNYPIETTQTCNCCQRELPFEDFDKEDTGIMVFYRQTCKRCLNARERVRLNGQVRQAVQGQFNRVFDPPPSHKECRVCGVDKPIEQFPKDYWGMRIYYRNVCRKCFSAQSRASKRRLAERRRNQPPPTDQ